MIITCEPATWLHLGQKLKITTVVLGQGNYDAIAGVLGMIVGSHLYVESAGTLRGNVLAWGERGTIMRSDLVHMRLGVFLAGFVPLPVVALWTIERWTG